MHRALGNGKGKRVAHVPAGQAAEYTSVKPSPTAAALQDLEYTLSRMESPRNRQQLIDTYKKVYLAAAPSSQIGGTYAVLGQAGSAASDANKAAPVDSAPPLSAGSARLRIIHVNDVYIPDNFPYLKACVDM